jgi:hypothetical protein
MLVLFDGELDVHYGFASVHAGDDPPDLIDARGGQSNGLCGAAIQGALSLVTGLHTGAVPLRIEFTDDEPPLDDAWEDVVEVSFTTSTKKLLLSTFEAAMPLRLLRAGTFRVRYCGTGLDPANKTDVRSEGDPELDRYLLQFWPAPHAPDAIVRETSDIARYWHGVARETPAPPPPSGAGEGTKLSKKAREREERQAAEDDLLRFRWGGDLPREDLLALSRAAQQLAQADPSLAEAVVDLDPEAAHALTVRVVRDACAFAGDVPVDWSPALDALEGRRPLPSPFDDHERAWAALYPPDVWTSSSFTLSSSNLDGHEDDESDVLDPPAGAMAALLRAVAEDSPAEAALAAIDQAAATRPDRPAYLARIRAELGLPSRPQQTTGVDRDGASG